MYSLLPVSEKISIKAVHCLSGEFMYSHVVLIKVQVILGLIMRDDSIQ